jgi:hypothetical protein
MTKTVFLDIDGTLIEHLGNMTHQLKKFPSLLPGTIDKLNEWVRKDYRIILTTGRKEGNRQETEDMLRSYGIPYDMLIMGLPRGPRVVVNDLKPGSTEATAVGVTIVRNAGISNVNI